MANHDNEATALLFEDKLGLGRYGGMAVAVTAVSQVAEQFTGAGLYVALAFSFLIALYYARRAIHLRLLDCFIWVPIYGCTLFITSLGSNNIVGTTQERSQFQQVRSAYENQIQDFQKNVETLQDQLNAYQTALDKTRKTRDVYRTMLETVAPGIPLPAPDTQPGAKAGDSDRWYGRLLSLFSPAEAHAQARPAPSDPAAAGTPQVDNEKIQQLLQQLKTLQAEEQQALKTIEQAPPPPPTEKPNNLSAPQEIEPKIWKKW